MSFTTVDVRHHAVKFSSRLEKFFLTLYKLRPTTKNTWWWDTSRWGSKQSYLEDNQEAKPLQHVKSILIIFCLCACYSSHDWKWQCPTSSVVKCVNWTTMSGVRVHQDCTKNARKEPSKSHLNSTCVDASTAMRGLRFIYFQSSASAGTAKTSAAVVPFAGSGFEPANSRLTTLKSWNTWPKCQLSSLSAGSTGTM